MSFGSCVVTHTFTNADTSPASGNVEFTLTQRVTNGTQTLVPGSITANLGSSGQLSQALTPNNDAGTNPQTSQWRVDFRVLGASEETFFITVPTNTATVDLGSLLPQNPLGG